MSELNQTLSMKSNSLLAQENAHLGPSFGPNTYFLLIAKALHSQVLDLGKYLTSPSLGSFFNPFFPGHVYLALWLASYIIVVNGSALPFYVAS